MRPSRWKHSQLFFELRVAHAWGLTPNQFWACGPEEQALMAAYVVADSKMMEWERQTARG